jgi:hypothetical protein
MIGGMEMKNPIYRFLLLASTVTIICVLIFSSGYFHRSGMAIQWIGAGLQTGTSIKVSVNNGVADTDALLVLSVAALMGSGVLWTLVNFKKDQ